VFAAGRGMGSLAAGTYIFTYLYIYVYIYVCIYVYIFTYLCASVIVCMSV